MNIDHHGEHDKEYKEKHEDDHQEEHQEERQNDHHERIKMTIGNNFMKKMKKSIKMTIK